MRTYVNMCWKSECIASCMYLCICVPIIVGTNRIKSKKLNKTEKGRGNEMIRGVEVVGGNYLVASVAFIR